MLNKADRRNTLCEVTIAGNDQPHPLSARRLSLNTSSTHVCIAVISVIGSCETCPWYVLACIQTNFRGYDTGQVYIITLPF